MSLRIAAATLLFASSASAHMIMAQPVPFSKDKLDNGPITGAQFPCKSQLGFTVSSMNEMKVGEDQTLSFTGSAIHGGGSCQLSITTDKEPTANSKFKVIKSMEGGCPGLSGPETFTYQIPSVVPDGQVTLAWTWFSKLSGVPELYMNCAPVTVSGGASDTSGFDALPDMFVANIDTVDCKTPTSGAVTFPNPGESVVKNEAGGPFGAPTGGSCGASSGGNNGASSSAAGTQPSSAPAGTQVSSAPAGTQTAVPSSPAYTSAPVSSAANTGGVFAPGASSAPIARLSSDSAAASTFTTLVTLASSQGSAVVPTSQAAPIGTAVTSAKGASPTGGNSASSCSENGSIVCNGTDQFGICNNGEVVWQAVASGTTCSNGQIQKRDYHRQLKGRIARPRNTRTRSRVIVGEDF